jgi:hypothetical protein
MSTTARRRMTRNSQEASMLVRTTLLITVLALSSSATALAAKSPRALALKASDFPARAKMLGIIDNSGPGGAEYAAVYSFKVAGREEEVTDKVWFVPDNAKAPVPALVAGPQSTYQSEVGQISGFHGEKSVSLPHYGDEQTGEFADYKNSDGAARAFGGVVVRTGNVIWVLLVEHCNDTGLAAASCVFGPTPPRITQAAAVSELKKYAAKQKARVGSG